MLAALGARGSVARRSRSPGRGRCARRARDADRRLRPDDRHLRPPPAEDRDRGRTRRSSSPRRSPARSGWPPTPRGCCARARYRLDHLSTLIKAAQFVSAELRLDTVLQRLVGEVTRLLDADAADCYLHDADRGDHPLRGRPRPRPGSLVGFEAPREQGLAGVAFRERRSVVSHDYRAHRGGLPEPGLRELQVRSGGADDRGRRGAGRARRRLAGSRAAIRPGRPRGDRGFRRPGHARDPPCRELRGARPQEPDRARLLPRRVCARPAALTRGDGGRRRAGRVRGTRRQLRRGADAGRGGAAARRPLSASGRDRAAPSRRCRRRSRTAAPEGWSSPRRTPARTRASTTAWKALAAQERFRSLLAIPLGAEGGSAVVFFAHDRSFTRRRSRARRAPGRRGQGSARARSRCSSASAVPAGSRSNWRASARSSSPSSTLAAWSRRWRRRRLSCSAPTRPRSGWSRKAIWSCGRRAGRGRGSKWAVARRSPPAWPARSPSSAARFAFPTSAFGTRRIPIRSCRRTAPISACR